MKIMHNTSRVCGHPSRIIIAIKGITIKRHGVEVVFQKSSGAQEHSIKLKERFQNLTPVNALEQATLNVITTILEIFIEETS